MTPDEIRSLADGFSIVTEEEDGEPLAGALLYAAAEICDRLDKLIERLGEATDAPD